MSDLLSQLQVTLQEAEQCRQTLIVAGSHAQQARTECDRVTADHEAGQLRVRLALQSLRERVQLCRQDADSAAHSLIQECEQVVAWAQQAQQELGQKVQQVQQQLNQASAQVHQLHGDLEDKRRLVSLEMTKNIALVEHETGELEHELALTQSFVSEQMLPGLQRRQAILAQQGEDMRALLLQRLLPDLAREFAATQKQLLKQAEILEQAGPGTAADARQATLDSLTQLGESMQALCARSAGVARASLEQLAADIPPVRSRVDELNKQTRTFQELGTPASGHLKMLVNVVAQLRELLIQSKVLSDLG